MPGFWGLDSNERGEMVSLDVGAVERHSLNMPEETEVAQREKRTHGRQTPFSSVRKAGSHPYYHCKIDTSKCAIFTAFIIIILIPVILIIVRAVPRGGEFNQICPDVNYSVVLGAACPSGWIGYEGKCYFFSEEERNWTSAQSFCISQGSSLAAVQSELERAFMLRFKGEADHWIGLRKDFNDTWIWADGSKYSNMLVVKGSENCTYLSKDFVIASRCHIPIKWICSHPDAYMRNKNSAAGKVVCQEEL